MLSCQEGRSSSLIDKNLFPGPWMPSNGGALDVRGPSNMGR